MFHCRYFCCWPGFNHKAIRKIFNMMRNVQSQWWTGRKCSKQKDWSQYGQRIKSTIYSQPLALYTWTSDFYRHAYRSLLDQESFPRGELLTCYVELIELNYALLIWTRLRPTDARYLYSYTRLVHRLLEPHGGSGYYAVTKELAYSDNTSRCHPSDSRRLLQLLEVDVAITTLCTTILFDLQKKTSCSR